VSKTHVQYLIDLPSHDIDPSCPTSTRVDYWSHRFGVSGEFKLRPAQAGGLTAADQLAKYPGTGAFIQAAVGSGKTLLALLLARVYADVKNPLLLVKPALIPELEAEIHRWRHHFKLMVPRVMAYSQLSRPESTDALRAIAPDLIIADEAQSLGNPKSARTLRFLRYMESAPGTRFIGMTGTWADKSISEYAHLMRLAIGPLCPLPEGKRPFNAWRSVLDVKGEPNDSDIDRFKALADHYNIPFGGGTALRRDAARLAYYTRLKTTPGVLLTTQSSCDEPLHITCVDPGVPQAIEDAMDTMEKDWVLPNGDEVVDGTEYARHAATLSVGFYNRWDWDAVDADSVWDAARKEWSSCVRRYLSSHAREGCDSPRLVEDWVRRDQPRNELTRALADWDAVRELQAPPTIPVWVTYEVMLWAKAWLDNLPTPSIIWYYSRAVAPVLEQLGVYVKTEKPKPDYKKRPRVALPITKFGTGMNLQEYRHHLLIEPRPSGKATEQWLGRSHRGGQDQAVHVDILTGTWKQRLAVRDSILRARFQQKTSGQDQKLLIAEWHDAPFLITKALRGIEAKDTP
jgi:hypothetical protein